MMISQGEAHKYAIKQGFWNDYSVNQIPIKLCLIHSEISEAMEADRTIYDSIKRKEAIGEELADVILRVLDLSEFLRIDIEKLVETRHNYNKTRSYKHDKRY